MSDDDISGTSRKRFGFLRRGRHGRKEKKASRASLKQRVEELEQQITALQEERTRLQRKLTEAVSNHPYHVRNLQIGDHCTMLAGSDMESLGDTIEEVEGLINKLTNALDRDVNERARLAMDNETTKIQLEELKDMIVEQSQKLQRLTETDTRTIDELKKMFVDLEASRSDEDLVGDCLTALTRHVPQTSVTEFKSLPVKAKPGIIRIVNKFDAVPWDTFARQIGLNQQSINVCSRHYGRVPVNEGLPQTDKLGKDTCTVILVEWIKQYGDTLDKFMQRMNDIQHELHAERIRRFRKEIIEHTGGRSQFRAPLGRGISTESILTTVTTRTERTERTQMSDQPYGEDRLHTLTEMIKPLMKDEPNSTLLKDMQKKINAIYDDRFVLNEKL